MVVHSQPIIFLISFVVNSLRSKEIAFSRDSPYSLNFFICSFNSAIEFRLFILIFFVWKSNSLIFPTKNIFVP